jgi:hypothetical protein
MITGSATTEAMRPRASDGATQVREFRKLLKSKNEALREHKYFRMCRNQELSPQHIVEVVKQLYCFSVFFERLLTRRITEYSTHRDQRILDLAREHLREEIGHTRLFHDCLARNGTNPEEIANVAPKMFTKALFGYLSTTLQHENEYVANVAIMQVMESIGFYFFTETSNAMKAHGMADEAITHHVEADEHHPEIGADLVADFDEATMANSVRVVHDIYRLMAFVLDEWMGLEPSSSSLARRRRTSRPPRTN